jgi:hypothetical protein
LTTHFANPIALSTGQPVIIDAFFEIFDLAAFGEVFVEFAEPWLDRVVAGFSSDLDLGRGIELLAADRRHVQTEFEALVHGRGFLGLGGQTGGG